VAKLLRHCGIKGRWATLRYSSPNLKKFCRSMPNQQHEHPAVLRSYIPVYNHSRMHSSLN
jgi:hypothetical protein